MKCKVLCVYVDSNGSQCMVDFSSDGWVSCFSLDSFVRWCLGLEVVMENFRITELGTLEGDFDTREYLSWSEIVEKYPSRWIAMDKVSLVRDDLMDVDKAAVVWVMSDDEAEIFRERNKREGFGHLIQRTTIDVCIGCGEFVPTFTCGEFLEGLSRGIR